MLAVRQNSGRCLRGSHRWPGSRSEKTRSLARERSSSRRAPPNAASYAPSSSACRSATVFMIRVYSWVPWVNGVTPSCTPSAFVWTLRSRSCSRAIRSRNSIISRNFQVVSMCRTGKGTLAGAKALTARCSRTDESLPML